MAIVIWKGTASGHEGDWDFDDALNSYADSNWVNKNGDGVAKPTDDDIVVFSIGSQSVTDGLDQSTVKIAKLIRGQGYTGDIGSESTPLEIGVTSEVRYKATNEGRAWIKLSELGSGPVTDVWVESVAPATPSLVLDGTIRQVYCLGGGGQIVIPETAEVVDILSTAPQLTVIVEAGVTGLQSLYARAGRVLSSADIINVMAAGGALVELGGGDFGVIHAEDNASVKYHGPGDITLLRVFGDRARVDFSGNTHSGPITIDVAEIYTGGVIDLRSSLDNVEITKTKYLGGQILQTDSIEISTA